MFVLAYRNADDRQSFSQFYLPRVMVKDYNNIIDNIDDIDDTILEFSKNFANEIY